MASHSRIQTKGQKAGPHVCEIKTPGKELGRERCTRKEIKEKTIISNPLMGIDWLPTFANVVDSDLSENKIEMIKEIRGFDHHKRNEKPAMIYDFFHQLHFLISSFPLSWSLCIWIYICFISMHKSGVTWCMTSRVLTQSGQI